MSESDSSSPADAGSDNDPVGASSAEPVAPDSVTSEPPGIAAQMVTSASDRAEHAADSAVSAAGDVGADARDSVANAVAGTGDRAEGVASSVSDAVTEASGAADSVPSAVDSLGESATTAGAAGLGAAASPWAIDTQGTAPVVAEPTAVAPVLPPDPADTWALSGQREVRGSTPTPPPPPPEPGASAPAGPGKAPAKRRRGLGTGLLIGGLAGALVATPLALAIRASDDDSNKSATSVEATDVAPLSTLAPELTDETDETDTRNDDTQTDDGASDDAGDGATAAADASAGASTGAATPAVIRSVLSRVGDSVVSINTTGFEEDLAQNVFPTAGAGSGVVIDSDGLILTNAHVVAGATEISVRFADGEDVKGTVVGRSTVTDLALVQVETDRELVAARLANSSSVQVGDSVIAIGNALALPGGPTVTAGIISAVDREIRTTGGVLTGLLQTSAAINPGNSGGPLLNVAGEVIGINTAVAGDAQNIGFAVSSSMASREIDAMTNGSGKATDQGFLGVSTQALNEQVASQLGVTSDFGAVVVEVLSGSAADEAGLQVRDVLIQIDGKDVRSAEAVRDAIAAHKSGDTVALKWLRGAEAMTGQATLQSRPVE